MEKKNINKVVVIAVAIAVIVAVVGGATFAYWQWVTSDEQQTAVNVTVAQGINMQILPEPVSPATLYPTNANANAIENCTGTGESITCSMTNSAVMRSYALVIVENQTGIMARPKFMLKLKITTPGGTNITNQQTADTGDGTKTYADYIKYAVVEGGKPSDISNPVYNLRGATWSGEWADEGDCDVPISAANNNIIAGTFTSNDQIDTTGWYNSDYITSVDNSQPINFPVISNTSVSFNVDPYTRTYHRYKVCAWVDSSYTYTNTGETVSDPLQDAIISVSWSDDSEVIQVTE